MARTNCRRGRVRALSRSGGSISGNSARSFRAGSAFHRRRRFHPPWRGSGLPFVRRKSERLALVLPPHSWLRGAKRSRLRICRASSPICVILHAASLGQRRSPPDLLPEPRGFSAGARRHLPDRFPFALVAGRWPDRAAGDSADRAATSSRARATWLRRFLPPPDTLLAQFERPLSPFSLRRGSRRFHLAHARPGPGSIARSAFRSLSVTRDRGPDLPGFSMGHPFARDRIPRDLFRSVAMAKKNRQSRAILGHRVFPAEA